MSYLESLSYGADIYPSSSRQSADGAFLMVPMTNRKRGFRRSDQAQHQASSIGCYTQGSGKNASNGPVLVTRWEGDDSCGLTSPCRSEICLTSAFSRKSSTGFVTTVFLQDGQAYSGRIFRSLARRVFNCCRTRGFRIAGMLLRSTWS